MRIINTLKQVARNTINTMSPVSQLTLWESEIACTGSLADVLEPMSHTESKLIAQATTEIDDSWSL
jgi:hypothetical protein